MSASSGFWQDLTTRDLRVVEPENTVVLLPVAAVEQHGPHLPLSTDATINAGVVEAALARDVSPARLLGLPAMTVGDSMEHAGFPGTLSIAATTLLESWLDVGRSVARAGVRKLVILNSHGGQIPLVDLAAVHLRVECRMLVARATTFRLGCPPGLFDNDELAHGLHGGEVETSLMLHLCPQQVRRGSLAEFDGLPARWARDGRVLGVEKPVGIGWLAGDLHPQGVCGNAAAADAGRGATLLAHWAEILCQVITEMAATPLSSLSEPDG